MASYKLFLNENEKIRAQYAEVTQNMLILYIV